jgi:hypothetical protein
VRRGRRETGMNNNKKVRFFCILTQITQSSSLNATNKGTNQYGRAKKIQDRTGHHKSSAEMQGLRPVS